MGIQIPPPHGLVDALVGRERRRNSAAGRNADVVFAATLCAQLRADVDARVFAPRADAADSQRLA